MPNNFRHYGSIKIIILIFGFTTLFFLNPQTLEMKIFTITILPAGERWEVFLHSRVYMDQTGSKFPAIRHPERTTLPCLNSSGTPNWNRYISSGRPAVPVNPIICLL